MICRIVFTGQTGLRIYRRQNEYILPVIYRITGFSQSETAGQIYRHFKNSQISGTVMPVAKASERILICRSGCFNGGFERVEHGFRLPLLSGQYFAFGLQQGVQRISMGMSFSAPESE